MYLAGATAHNGEGTIDVEATIVALLRRGRSGFSVAAFLSVVQSAVALAVTFLPLWEVTTSSSPAAGQQWDVTFWPPQQGPIRACPLGGSASYPNDGCQTNPPSIPERASNINVSTVSAVAFSLTIPAITCSLLKAIQSYLLARNLSVLLGITALGAMGELVPAAVLRAMSPLSIRAAMMHRFLFRCSGLATFCLSAATLTYIIMAAAYIPAAFSASTFGTITSSPSIGFILMAMGAVVAVVNTILLVKFAKILPIVQSILPSHRTALGPANLSTITNGYAPIPIGASSDIAAAIVAAGLPVILVASPAAAAVPVAPQAVIAGGQYYPSPPPAHYDPYGSTSNSTSTTTTTVTVGEGYTAVATAGAAYTAQPVPSQPPATATTSSKNI
jgi:hypothetical protein